MPSGPCSIGQVMSSVAASNTSWETWRSFSSSWLRRIGWSITSWWACSGDSASRLTSAPTPAWRLITTLLADRVDRRVGDLREQLLEVGEQRRLAVGEHRQRGVVAHARDRLLALRAPSARSPAAGPPASSRTPAAWSAAARSAASAARARAGRRCGRPSARTTRAYGLRRATRRLTSSSSTIRPSSRSTRNSLPGASRPLRWMCSGATVITPVSEASTT